MRSDNFFIRALASLLVGISAPGSVFAASHFGANPGYWLIAIPISVLIAAVLAGYFEPSARRVWIHALLLILPELVALPVAILTCKGHGCAAIVALLAIAVVSTFVLIAVSYAAFFIRRRRTFASAGIRA